MQDEPISGLPEGAFVGREAFRQRVRAAILAAANERWRELVFSDADFEDWPLNERPVIEALGTWVRQSQGLVMLARRYDGVVRTHPLFTEWRKFWSHKIECRQCAQADAQDLPSALWAPAWNVQRMNTVSGGGISGTDPERQVVLRQTLDEWIKRSTAGFPATSLGL